MTLTNIIQGPKILWFLSRRQGEASFVMCFFSFSFTAEYVVFCKPTPQQINLYRKVLSSSQINSLLNCSSDGNQHLVWINELKKICNYPGLLSGSNGDGSDSTSVNQVSFQLVRCLCCLHSNSCLVCVVYTATLV